MTTDTDQLEARAAWYAAHIIHRAELIDERVERGDRAGAIRAHQGMERIKERVAAEGLGAMVEAVQCALLYDAEGVADLIASAKPRLPR